jgi:hypothetical protein
MLKAPRDFRRCANAHCILERKRLARTPLMSQADGKINAKKTRRLSVTRVTEKR